MNNTSSNGRHVVVAGGGFAGLAAAYTLRERLGPRDRVTVVEPSGRFVFALSLVWAVLGRSIYRGTFALDPALTAKGIDYLRSAVHEVRAEEKLIRTAGGEMTYDRLIIATGGRPDTSSIPGLAGEFRAAHWIVGEESAVEARESLRLLFDNPGPVVVGAAPGATYFSGAYELVLALDSVLRERGLRDRIPLTFITGQPYLGDLGFNENAARTKLETLFAARNITYRTGVEIERVESDDVILGSGERLPASVSIIMPPFTGAADIWKSPHLTDEHGFVPINERYQHVRFPDIYAAGVASVFDRPIPPLTAQRAPHTGYLSVRMGQAAAQNAAASLGFGPPARHTLPYVFDVRLLDGGSIGLFLASWGTNKPHNLAIELPGQATHYLKALQERYLVWRLRTGRMDLP
ncbi:MAG TPA: FAD/NAD(P)-binding oxidoreductase [Chloroflexota bacterium]|nr:FAD/NAD(P)-binding oxidoreductase [Chloroflexota bacterium]